MLKQGETPVVRCAGSELLVSEVVIEESPLAGSLEPLCRIEVAAPAADLERDPRRGEPLTVAVDGRGVQGTVADVERIVTPHADKLKLTGVTSLERARSSWTTHVRNLKRSALLDLALGGAKPSSIKKARCDEKHDAFVSLSRDGWEAASFLALSGGQVLLATTEGYVLARPDAGDPVNIDPDAQRAKLRAVPTITLVGMSSSGDVVSHTHKGSSDLGHITRFHHHATSKAELRAMAISLASLIEKGEFEVEGGRDLLEIGPGAWVKTDRMDARLVTQRKRRWTEFDGWRVSLNGHYSWEDYLFEGSCPEDESAEVTGFDDESGRMVVRYLRHDLEVPASQRADRAGRDQYYAVFPNVGDRGVVTFQGAYELPVYLGAPLPTGQVSKNQFERTIQSLRDPNSSFELTSDGRLSRRVKESNHECEGIETKSGKKFVFKRRKG